ncbi:MAG: aminodeoxychorismate synthase component I [Campylobacterota bacterium]|nr:aminodeoxychorismate synthase component I [Campylobacterota bacterium]
MCNKDLIYKLNNYGSKKEPFLFIVDYELKNYEIFPLSNLPNNIQFTINKQTSVHNNLQLKKQPITKDVYKKMFDKVQENISNGNTYLLNLTSKTTLKTELSLKDIYNKSHAKYKLLYKDKFVCFSPERFCNIENNKIFTYPMKGTIDANIPNAKEKILKNKKELAEHTMVVDLLRNDLSIISNKVKVENFRYCETISAGEKKLIQVSSKISGELTKNWQNNIGNIIVSLLPAGSITGTPKKKTIELIDKIEDYKRGYFTGVFGVFDGETLDSGVMIRFIEKENNKFYYKSGGGITSDSILDDEYQEMLDKVYIP